MRILILSLWMGLYFCSSCNKPMDSSSKDIATNVNDEGTGRGLLFHSLFRIDLIEDMPMISKGVCSGKIDLRNCLRGIERNRVSIKSFLDVYYPNLSKWLWQIADTQVNDLPYLKILEHYQDNVNELNGEELNLARKFHGGLTRGLSKKISRQKIDRFNQDFAGVFELFNLLSDPTQLHRYDAKDIGQLPSELAQEIRNLPGNFRKAQISHGINCKTLNSARFRNAHGGCQDTASGLVWGPTEIAGGAEVWKNFGSAESRCADRNYGNHYDWRLPSKDELLSVVGFYNVLPVHKDPYYWAGDRAKRETVVDKDFDLPEEVVRKKSRTILLGFNRQKTESISNFSTFGDTFNRNNGTHTASGLETGDRSGSSSSKPVYGQSQSVTTAIDRTLGAKFQVNVAERYLVNLWKGGDSRIVTLKEHELISAGAVLHERLRTNSSRPVAGTEHYRNYATHFENFVYNFEADNSWYNLIKHHRAKKSSLDHYSYERENTRIVGYDRDESISDRYRNVNPFRFIEFDVSTLDISQNKIGLVCVRDGES